MPAYHSDPSRRGGVCYCLRQGARGMAWAAWSAWRRSTTTSARHRQHLGLFPALVFLTWPYAHLANIPACIRANSAAAILRQLHQRVGHGSPVAAVARRDRALDIFDAIMHDPLPCAWTMLEPATAVCQQLCGAALAQRVCRPCGPSSAISCCACGSKMPNARALAPEFPGRNGFPRPVPA